MRPKNKTYVQNIKRYFKNKMAEKHENVFFQPFYFWHGNCYIKLCMKK